MRTIITSRGNDFNRSIILTNLEYMTGYVRCILCAEEPELSKYLADGWKPTGNQGFRGPELFKYEFMYYEKAFREDSTAQWAEKLMQKGKWKYPPEARKLSEAPPPPAEP